MWSNVQQLIEKKKTHKFRKIINKISLISSHTKSQRMSQWFRHVTRYRDSVRKNNNRMTAVKKITYRGRPKKLRG